MTRRESFAPQDDRVRELRFSGGQGGKTALLRETGRENCTPQGDRAGKLCGSEGQKCMSLWDDKMEQYAAQNDKMKYSAVQNSKMKRYVPQEDRAKHGSFEKTPVRSGPGRGFCCI